MKIFLSRTMDRVTSAGGSVYSFVVFWIVVVIWLASGRFLQYSDGWQLLINTPTTIITTALGFAILHSTKRDTKALHAKLDELIAATSNARDDLIHAETDTEEEIDTLRK